LMINLTFILSALGFTFVVAGLGLLIYGVVWRMRRSGFRGEFGGLVMIGPFPIVFGSGKGMVKLMTILSIILIVVFVVLWILPFLSGGVPG